jgi:sulfur carrier protein
MELSVNGEPRELPDGTTVAQLLATLELASARVAVEVNTQVVKKADHASRILRPGDAVEVVAFVGGG